MKYYELNSRYHAYNFKNHFYNRFLVNFSNKTRTQNNTKQIFKEIN